MADWVDNFHEELSTQSMGCSVPQQQEQVLLLADLYKQGVVSQKAMMDALGVDRDFELSMVKAEMAKADG